ncbi:MAG TPA: MFS transporter, partial [Acidimicrobiia bacterium]|nr:MFS transporter [Acidimicrobiia bacterium]
IGVYRLWRDLGFVAGALLAGIVADVVGVEEAILTVAAVTAASGFIAWARMSESHVGIASGNQSTEEES